jgi:hypothetical protein
MWSGMDNTKTLIQGSGYIAEIIPSASRVLGGIIFHYVIQREGSSEIVHWGQEVSLQRAKECVKEFIDQRNSKSFPATWGA